MSRNLVVTTVVTLIALISAGCGGGGGSGSGISLGNAHPWCVYAEDLIRATEAYSKVVGTEDAANSDSRDDYVSALNQVDYHMRGLDRTSRSALESLRFDARYWLDVQDNKDSEKQADRDNYRIGKKNFDEAKDTMAKICGS
ncbi:MAG: hypothetical protein OXH29_00180 [bacterium]|nr:hypothetical protein [bacterium]